MDEVRAASIKTFEEFTADHEHLIDLIILKNKQRGIDIDEVTAWKYMAWCNWTVADLVAQMSPTAAQMVNQFVAIAAEACSRQFRQKRTGILEPPTGRRFETPAELEQLVNPNNKPATFNHQGYL